jgi:hypothetical protein
MHAAPPPVVTSEGVRGVLPGATSAAVSKRWKTTLALVGLPGCSIAAVKLGRATGYALFRNGRFAGVFFEAGAATDRGVRIGSSTAALQSAYPGIARRAGSYFTQSLRFDVDRRGRVIRIGYGRVERTSCS